MTTAFDSHAADYDSVATSALGVELRSRVRAVLNELTAPGDIVADIGCGSGLDAAWLAPQVAGVSAFDASTEMVEHARRRCSELSNVSVHHADIAHLQPDQTFDVVLANFGVVNCVGDLESFGHTLASMLQPNGYAVLVTMTRWCPIELAIAVGSANRDLLTRRHRTHADGDYQALPLTYASARGLSDALGEQFELVRAASLGLTLPPFEQRHWVETRPRLRGALAWADDRIAPLGARLGVGDHHIAVVRLRP